MDCTVEELIAQLKELPPDAKILAIGFRNGEEIALRVEHAYLMSDGNVGLETN